MSEGLEKRFCEDEYFDYVVYREFASREDRESVREVLYSMAEQEYRHYEFWKRLSGECKGGIPRWKLSLLLAARRILGLTFTIKLLERHENSVIKAYKEYLSRVDGDVRRELERIIEDEESHEKALLNTIDESLVRYLGFIALGLSDAIIEITGVHAGFLGATATALVAGIAGLIVGLSAAISMAAAAYVQAKHERNATPGLSALSTGIAYFIAVVILAAPYFVTHSNVLAFIASVILAIALILAFTFYSSVINETGFIKEAGETLGVLMVTAIAAYLFGDFLGRIFGIQGIFG